MKVSLLTGGADKPYSLGILQALIAKGIDVDFIGNDEMSRAKIATDTKVRYLNFRGDQSPDASTLRKIARVMKYYIHLLRYTIITDSPLFHILWYGKFALFNRIILNIYFKLLGKKLVFTAHNIDERQRDGRNNFINRLTLKIMYVLVDHVFVHTTKMKDQLIREFDLAENKVSTIPFGINNTIPKTDLTRIEARAKLNLLEQDKIILFFGHIAPYKGLEYLLHAMKGLMHDNDSYKLIIAGPIKGCNSYWENIESIIDHPDLDRCVIKHIKFIPDKDVEIFFKSSDVLVLPYKFIFQSGVLFLSYSFGLPAIATDVGSMREYIEEGKTGRICRSEDPDDLAETIRSYFESDLFRNLDDRTEDIMGYGNQKGSWSEVGNITLSVYGKLLA